MDIRHLRQILAIRDHGSFAKAAEALHVAQPALSKSMAKLERDLSLTLFTRTSTGSALTPMGDMIAERAERVMAATQNLTRDAALVAGGDEGIVRLGIGNLLKSTLLPPLLMKIIEAHPHLRLQIELGSGHRLLPLVQTRELDLALCSANPTHAGLAYVEVVRTELVFVASPAHPLASERGIPIERLAAFFCAGPSMPGSTVSAFLGLPSDRLDAYSCNDFEPMLPLARGGHAVLIAPHFMVRDAMRSGELVRIDVQWAGTLAYGGYTTHAASFSPILAKIMGYAVEIGQTIQQDWPDRKP